MRMTPVSVVVAAGLQVLLAVGFVLLTWVARRDGDAAERAAEAEVVRQGQSAGVLSAHRVKFKESAREALFPYGIAACLTAVAVLVLAGYGPARVASYVLAGLAIVGGGLVMTSQVFAEQVVCSAFRKSADPEVRSLNGRAVVAAARTEFPSWTRVVQLTRLLVATVGSVAVIVLLSLPSADAHFR
ncbi:hypothetical protein ACIBL3_11490 [Kribbella sp. NPDC050124]|uniref:hypothetical protein n=1 Tax=Kribbella sp. NPDC050124 TaxID=3364114 RepID=UPI0037B89ADA